MANFRSAAAAMVIFSAWETVAENRKHRAKRIFMDFMQ
jgi:hypothetical protein